MPLEIIDQVMSDEILFAETFVKVVNMHGALVPFRTDRMPMQEDFVKRFIKTKTPRVVELKARRVGGTTLFMVLGMVRAMKTRNFECALLAQNEPEARNFMKMWQRLYTDMVVETALPNGSVLKVRPDVDIFSDHMIQFPALNSRLTIGSAGSSKFGRGRGLNMVIGTEASKWDVERPSGTAAETWAMVEGALTPDSFAVLESTAYGAGGFFYDTYMGAKGGNSGWTPAFYTWMWHKDYVLEEGDPNALEDDKGAIVLTEEESKLGITESQARWRRAKIARMPGRDHEAKLGMFLQEYPEDDITCFAVSGAPYFSIPRIDTMVREARPVLRSEQEGNLAIWQMPRVGESYIIGADPGGNTGATGRADKRDLKDFCAAIVIDSRGTHVASLHGRWDTRQFSEELAKLGKLFNDACLAVESGPYGDSILLLLSVYLKYPNLYAEKDPITGKTLTLGKRTTWQSKPAMADAYKEMFESGTFSTNDTFLLSEMRNFHRIPSSSGQLKLGAIAGHDDRVMAAVIASWVWMEGGWRKSIRKTQIFTNRRTRVEVD